MTGVVINSQTACVNADVPQGPHGDIHLGGGVNWDMKNFHHTLVRKVEFSINDCIRIEQKFKLDLEEKNPLAPADIGRV